MSSIEADITEVELLALEEKLSHRKLAAKHGSELIKYTNVQCKRGIPPLRGIFHG